MNDPRQLQRVIDVTGAVLAVALAVGGAFAVPAWFDAGRERHEAEHAQLSGLLGRKQTIHTRQESTRRELDAVEARLRHAIERVPDEADEAAFLAEVVDLFEKSDVELRDYRTGRPITRDTHGELDVTIGGTCDYAGLCRALAGLKNSPRAGRVVLLDVSLGGQTAEIDSEDEAKLDFELTWRLYSRPETVATAEANDERR